MNHQQDHPEFHPALDRALASLRDHLRQVPDEATATRHLTAMRRAATEEAPVGWWAGRRERSTLRRNPMPALTPRWLAVSTAAIFGFTGGLAAADLLPDPAQNIVAETVSKVGIDLPDPDDRRGGDDVKGAGEPETDGFDTDDNPNNDHGKTVSSVARDDSLTGCEKGQAVREVASSKSQGQGNGHTEGHDPCAKGQGDDVGEDGEDGDGGGPPAGLGEDDDQAPGNSGSAPGRGRGGPPSSAGADDGAPGNSGDHRGHGPGGSGAGDGDDENEDEGED